MHTSLQHVKVRRWPALWLAGIAATAAALALLNSPPAESQANSGPAPTFAGPGTVAFADVIERVSPAVVNVSVTKVARPVPTASLPNRRTPSPFSDSPLEEFFGRFFGAPGAPGFGEPRRSEGQGSGFVIDADGLVATNNHVVDGAESVTVTLSSGEEFDAVVVGRDPQTDIALLRVDADQPLPALTLGDSDRARVGDWVLAIGNPFGLGGSATAGIISARGRDIQSGPYDDYLQIDAPINPGNSGGPVFNGAGEVIGINTAIFSPNGGNIGIGFAIPSNLARQVLADLEDGGTVDRGWLGVQIQPIDSELAATLGLPEAKGALIAEVSADSPAERAGLVAGDVVTEFAGRPVDSPRELARVVGSSGAGERVELEIWRDGRSRTVAVDLGRLGGDEVVAGAAPTRGNAGEGFGLTLEDLTAPIREDLGLEPDVRGAVVVDVVPGSPAAEQGIRRGDVVVSVNQDPTGSAREAADALAATSGDRALVLIRRGEARRFVALKRA